MTKLMEWLSVLLTFLAVYLALVTRQFKSEWTEAWMFQIQIFPIIAVGVFGVRASRFVSYSLLKFFPILLGLLGIHCSLSSFYI